MSMGQKIIFQKVLLKRPGYVKMALPQVNRLSERSSL